MYQWRSAENCGYRRVYSHPTSVARRLFPFLNKSAVYWTTASPLSFRTNNSHNLFVSSVSISSRCPVFIRGVLFSFLSARPFRNFWIERRLIRVTRLFPARFGCVQIRDYGLWSAPCIVGQRQKSSFILSVTATATVVHIETDLSLILHA